MRSVDRHQKIVELVMEMGSVSVPDLCQRFAISEMTARRDLNELDRQGMLRRVHGGAVASLGRSYEPPFPTRVSKNQTSKMSIGLKAASLIYDGDSLALDVGTTTLEIVQGLVGKRNLTILTSCLQIANQIVDKLSLEVDARLILTGGIVRPHELSLVGAIPERTYQDFHVDKAFIGIGGISPTDGLTEYNIEDAQIKRMLIRSAREKIVVADSSKFGKTTFSSVSPITSVNRIITDRDAPRDVVEKIREAGVEVILCN